MGRWVLPSRSSTDSGVDDAVRKSGRAYNLPMRSVADDLRREQRARELRMTPAERVALALRLGEEELRMFCSARGLDRAEALRQLRDRRQAARRRRA